MAGFGFGNAETTTPTYPQAQAPTPTGESAETAGSLTEAEQAAPDHEADESASPAADDEPENTNEEKTAGDRDEKPRKRGRPKKQAVGDGPDRTLVRRVANKVESLLAADEDQVNLLAAVLGSQRGAVDVTVAVMTSEKRSLSALDDTIRIADADVALRAVEAMSLGHGGLMGVWKVLGHFDLVPGRFPSDELTATKKIIVALGELSDDHRATITDVAELAKKS